MLSSTSAKEVCFGVGATCVPPVLGPLFALEACKKSVVPFLRLQCQNQGYLKQTNTKALQNADWAFVDIPLKWICAKCSLGPEQAGYGTVVAVATRGSRGWVPPGVRSAAMHFFLHP